MHGSTEGVAALNWRAPEESGAEHAPTSEAATATVTSMVCFIVVRDGANR
jgi:hypothetical protein